MTYRAFFPILLLSLPLAAGCAGPGPERPGGEDETLDPVAGRYQVTSTYDLSSSERVPELIGDAIAPLSGLSEDPAGTLIAVLQSGDSQVVDDLLDAIPSTLMDTFKSAVNDFILDQIEQGNGDIVLFTDDLAGMLTHFDVVSQLDVGLIDPAGRTTAGHRLSAVAFDYRGERQLVDTPELVNVLTAARDVECSISMAQGEGEIDIGDHAFHLPLGDFAVTGFNMGLEQTLGVSSLREALGSIIDCRSVAQSVAQTCLGPVCVGHEAEIEMFCDAGLDAVAERVEARIASIDFAELRLATGRASLRDAAKEDGLVDGVVDQMEAGTWQTDINIDGLVVPVPATFHAVRLSE